MSDAWPINAMNPTAAATDIGMSASHNPNTPPVNAKGTLKSVSNARGKLLKALKSSSSVSSSATGTTWISRFIARSLFSNSPPHSMVWPGISGASFSTRARASSTKPPRSRSRTFMRMPM